MPQLIPVAEYPHQTRVHPPSEGVPAVRFDGGHDREHGVYSQKICFATELKVTKLPALIGGGSDPFARDEVGLPEHPIASAYRLADALQKLDARPIPTVLLAGQRSAPKIKMLVLHEGTEHAESARIMNADADEVWFVYGGNGGIRTSFGLLRFVAGDYIYIPKLVAYTVGRDSASALLVGIESGSPLLQPAIGGSGAPYNPSALVLPEPSPFTEKPDRASSTTGTKEFDVFLLRESQWTRLTFDDSPFSCVGWSGTRYPFVLHTTDLNFPNMTNAHTDPYLYATFATEDNDVVISTFTPRRMHSLPYFHLNEWDECLFLARAYGARKGVLGAGDMSFHPRGFLHGPHPEALAAWSTPATPADAPWVNDLAVMFETRAALAPTTLARRIEIPEYWKSWQKK